MALSSVSPRGCGMASAGVPITWRHNRVQGKKRLPTDFSFSGWTVSHAFLYSNNQQKGMGLPRWTAFTRDDSSWTGNLLPFPRPRWRRWMKQRELLAKKNGGLLRSMIYKSVMPHLYFIFLSLRQCSLLLILFYCMQADVSHPFF